MKKTIFAALVFALLLLAGCGQKPAEPEAQATSAPLATALPDGANTATLPPLDDLAAAAPAVDVDLTQMGGTMVYSYVYNIVTAPEEHEGKRFRIAGTADEITWVESEAPYRYIVIEDATLCCAQGLVYMLVSDAYPEIGARIEITGTLMTYTEEPYTYPRIIVDSIRTL